MQFLTLLKAISEGTSEATEKMNGNTEHAEDFTWLLIKRRSVAMFLWNEVLAI